MLIVKYSDGRILGEGNNIPRRLLTPQGEYSQAERNREIIEAMLSSMQDFELEKVCKEIGYSTEWV